MTPELERLATARHKAFIEWDRYTLKGDTTEGLFAAFCAANREYVRARQSTQATAKANVQGSLMPMTK